MKQRIWALILGSTGGTAEGFIDGLIKQGCHVVGIARNMDKLASLQGNSKGNFTGIACDVKDEISLKKACEHACDLMKGWQLMVVVNNLGGAIKLGNIVNLEKVNEAIIINYIGPKVFYESIKSKIATGGHYICMLSGAAYGTSGNPNFKEYSMYKKKLMSFMLKEIGTTHFRICLVYPIYIGGTDFMPKVGGEDPAKNSKWNGERTARYVLKKALSEDEEIILPGFLAKLLWKINKKSPKLVQQFLNTAKVKRKK